MSSRRRRPRSWASDRRPASTSFQARKVPWNDGFGASNEGVGDSEGGDGAHRRDATSARDVAGGRRWPRPAAAHVARGERLGGVHRARRHHAGRVPADRRAGGGHIRHGRSHAGGETAVAGGAHRSRARRLVQPRRGVQLRRDRALAGIATARLVGAGPAGRDAPDVPRAAGDVTDLHVLHTSCRKAHGGGRDALAAGRRRGGHALQRHAPAPTAPAAAHRRPDLRRRSGSSAAPAHRSRGRRRHRHRRDRRLRHTRRPSAVARTGPTPSASLGGRGQPRCGPSASSWRCTSSPGRRCSGRPAPAVPAGAWHRRRPLGHRGRMERRPSQPAPLPRPHRGPSNVSRTCPR